MATNPMQRQARNSFLLGMVFALLIGAAVAVFLFMQLKNVKEELAEEQANTVKVYILNSDVKSGQVITSDLFTLTEVKSAGVPADATSDITTTLSTYSLCDNEGNPIYTEYYTDKDGYEEYKEMGGSNDYDETASSTNPIAYCYMTVNEEKIAVDKEDYSGQLYTIDDDGNKTYITTTEQALIAKVDLKAKTVLSASFITRSDEAITDDLRTQEYNVISLPTELLTGDYVDIRLMLPTGQDYIVIAKKQVTVPMVNGEYLADTIQVNLTEEEILLMSNAIVEAWLIEGSKLYVTTYTDAGLQEAATPTYVSSDAVNKLITSDPNIIDQALTELANRINSTKDLRDGENGINSAIGTYGEDNEGAVTDGMEESVESALESRQEYLQSLTATTTTN